MQRVSPISADSPALLTVEEAARIGRCSIKTVRRAYATGALTAYRRRGSRAVLLDSDDVVAWAQGELLQPAGATTPASEFKAGRRFAAKPARRGEEPTRAAKLASQLRFDVSSEALRARRKAQTEPGP
jgi:excisionase family DNA binding protein